MTGSVGRRSRGRGRKGRMVVALGRGLGSRRD